MCQRHLNVFEDGIGALGQRIWRGVVMVHVMRGLVEVRAVCREAVLGSTLRQSRTLVSNVFNVHIRQVFVLVCVLTHTQSPPTSHLQ